MSATITVKVVEEKQEPGVISFSFSAVRTKDATKAEIQVAEGLCAVLKVVSENGLAAAADCKEET